MVTIATTSGRQALTTMNRDDFLAALISELEQQRNQDVEGFDNPKAFTPAEIFRKLCYDYPVVTPADVEVLWVQLAEQFDAATTKAKSAENKVRFSLDPKFTENMIHIAGTIPSADDNKALIEQSSILCAMIFIKLMKYMLSCKRKELSQLLDVRSTIETTATETHAVSSESPLLEWSEIVTRFSSTMSHCTASLLHSVPEAVIVKYRLLQDFTDIIGSLNPFTKPISRITGLGRDNSALSSFSLAELYSHTVACINVDHVMSAEEPSDGKSVNNTEMETMYNVLRELWVQRIFLSRDILSLSPALVTDQLPVLVNQLLDGVYSFDRSSGQWQYLLRESKFPVANECLVVIIFASIGQNILSKLEYGSNNRNTSNKRVLQKFRVYLESLLGPLTNICERMCLYGSTSDEGVSLAIDICSVLLTNRIYCSDGEARCIDAEMNRVIDKLVTSRLWPWLVHSYLAHASADGDNVRNILSPAVLSRCLHACNSFARLICGCNRPYELFAMASAESETAYNFVNVPAMEKHLARTSTELAAFKTTASKP
jgi:hypothetical protein